MPELSKDLDFDLPETGRPSSIPAGAVNICTNDARARNKVFCTRLSQIPLYTVHLALQKNRKA